MAKTKAAKLSAAELNYKTKRLVVTVDAVTRIFCALIDCGKLVLPFIFIYYCVRELAGKSTQMDMVVKAVTDLKADKAFAYLFGIGGVAWGIAERKFRKRKTASLAARSAKAEKMLDSRRSSSGLPSSGDTRRDDAL